jgi:hypothetical protein
MVHKLVDQLCKIKDLMMQILITYHILVAMDTNQMAQRIDQQLQIKEKIDLKLEVEMGYYNNR